jgi:hypothetical protein
MCSSRWGLIAEPANETDNRTRWYYEALRDLHHTMDEHNVEITTIEMSRSAWNAISALVSPDFTTNGEEPNSGMEIARLFDIPVKMIASLMDGAILLRARNAPAGSVVSPGRKPVQKIGGVGGRAGVVGESTRPRDQTMLGALERLYETDRVSRRTLLDAMRLPEAPPPEVLPTPTPIPVEPPPVLLEKVSNAVRDQRKPKAGDRFTSRRTGKTVDVLRIEERDGMWAVALQESSYGKDTLPNSPTILWANDFVAEYVPFGSSARQPEPEPVAPLNINVSAGEEWYSAEHNEYVTVESLDLRKMKAVARGASTGKLRNIHLDDFNDETKCKRIVRTTAHRRLMGDDEY